MSATRLACLFVAAVGVLAPQSGWAQASLQVPLEFDFLNPGARSLAMGSAFAGLADDATAAYTNPAGLTILPRPEVSLELRGRRGISRFLERGRLSGTTTNRGIDTITGPQYGEAIDSNVAAGFVSFVLPIRNRAAVAFYRHEIAHVTEGFATQGVYQFDTGIASDIRETALIAGRELRVVGYGGAVSVRISDRLSVGGGLTITDSSMDSTFTRYVTFPQDEPATYAPERAVFRGTQTGSGIGVGGSAGVMWKPRPGIQVGAVVRRSASFDFSQSLKDLPGGPPTTLTGRFRMPNVVAVGVSWRPTNEDVIAIEITRVGYGALNNDFVQVQARPSGRQSNFSISSGIEIHAGFEHVLTALIKPLSLRAGYWLDPAHAVKYLPSPAADISDERFSAYLPSQKALSHVTFGAGMPLTDRLELNVGADLSSRRSFVSILAVARY